jgi:hypothetical protein
VVPVRLPVDHLDRDDKNRRRGAGVGFGGVGSYDGWSVFRVLICEVIGPLGQVASGRLHRIIGVRWDGQVHGAGLGGGVVLGQGCGSQTYAGRTRAVKVSVAKRLFISDLVSCFG